jgi:hypothetical protein
VVVGAISGEGEEWRRKEPGGRRQAFRVDESSLSLVFSVDLQNRLLDVPSLVVSAVVQVGQSSAQRWYYSQMPP